MANAQLSKTLAQFTARVQRSKNRLVTIPAEVQRQIGLEGKRDNDIVLVSLRLRGCGRWSRHYLKLTAGNKFGIPSDVVRLGPGDEIDVRVHRVLADIPAASRRPRQQTVAKVLLDRMKQPHRKKTGAGLLLELAAQPRPGWRTDGSRRLDEYLDEDIRDRHVR